MISKDRQGLVEEIVTMTPEEAGVVTDVVVDEEVEADGVTAADSVKIEDNRIDRLILIEVIKDGVVPLVVEVVGGPMTGSFLKFVFWWCKITFVQRQRKITTKIAWKK